jgi:ABC-type multidrug transport system ATPase subunit
MSIIKIENLSVQYLEQDTKALDGVSLEVEEGEFIAILGAHGAGKTTLCLSINGIVPNMIQADMFGKIEVAGEVPPKIPVESLRPKLEAFLITQNFK